MHLIEKNRANFTKKNVAKLKLWNKQELSEAERVTHSQKGSEFV